MSKLPDMGKMIGPLPLGAWIIVVGGGVGIMVYTQKKTAATPAADPTVTDPGVGVGGSGQWVNLTPPAVDTTGKPTTNDEWGVKAINYLVGSGYPAALADQAIRKYLGTEALGVSEVAMVNAALLSLGPPPQILPPPIIGIPTSPPPAPTPPSRPYTYHTVTITQTLPSIAASYKKPVTDLWNANKVGVKRLDGSAGFLKSYALHHGQVLIIPWVKPVHL